MLATHAWAADAFLRPDALQDQRSSWRYSALLTAVNNLLYATPDVVALGDDPLVQQMMSAVGFDERSYVAKRFASAGSKITGIALIDTVWKDAELRHLALEVKRQASAERTRCLLLPQSSLTRGVRGMVANAISLGRKATYSGKEIDVVLQHLRSARISTLHECAFALGGHRDPFGAVLAMGASGLIDIDRSKPITTSTWVTSNI
ncbi:hypothetical protein ASG47_07310 [Devosia sp. Leaf420]|uniref:hypothetical protein n=1 Tax=Devosia sp. Leaf420 TaxID=1736374 RepID=UPI000714E143|nr:hypothetical protein [Devosia sp. Leaf420]KQT48171.1 hypothetical protein ASG47_07310 [Devosia sp. Leaf420]